jgi:PAS domain S-box-containing protein
VPDDTRRLRRVAGEPGLSPLDQLRELTAHLQQASVLLRQQQTFLRQQGMNLPPGTGDTVRTALQRLEGLEDALLGHQIELRQFRGLAQTTAVINSTLELDAVLNQVMDTVIQLTGAERGYILLRDPISGRLGFQVARGLDREQLLRDEFQVSQTIVHEVATTGRPVLTDNARQDPRYGEQESIVGFALRSILAVPLRVQQDIIGVVYCDNRILSGVFKQHELNLLRAFADQAAVAIQNARLFEAARAHLAEITQVRDLMNRVFTSVDSGLIALDAEGCVTLFNPAAERITGVAAAEALGRPLDTLLPAFSAQIAPHLTGMRASSAARHLELELAYDERGPRLWSVVFSPLQGEGAGALGAALVLDDLTESRRREQQVAQVRQYLPLALVENLRSADFTALGGQERDISVLFCDLRGFTRFSETLEPEDVMRIVNRYLTVASDAIHAAGGLVDKYMGDAVTGLFNTQLNPEPQHTLRALQAAIALRRAVADLHSALPPEQRLAYGIGLHTGAAVLGNVGSAARQEFTALGDGMDVARSLQEAADGGQIMLSAAACAALKGRIEVEAAVQTRARAQDVEAFCFLRVREGQQR